VDRRILFMLYYAFIHSRLIYLLPIWGHAPKIYFTELFYLQKKAVRFILFRAFDSSTFDLFDENFLSLNQLRIYETCIALYKMHHGNLRCGFSLVTNSEITNRNTRQSNTLRLPGYRTSTAQNSFFYNGINNYNNLPTNIKKCAKPCNLQEITENTYLL
jgi:hypothetical protein